MRAILAQTSDLDEALDGFGEKDAKTWSAEEKRKDRKALSLIQLHLSNNILQEVLAEKSAAALWLKLESIYMSKDLTSKMHVKMKLFSHRLQEGGSITLDEVQDALKQREKIKLWCRQMAHYPRLKLCKFVAGPSRDLTTMATEIRAKTAEVVRSPRERTSSAGIVRNLIMLLMIVGSCRIRRKETELTNRKIGLKVLVRLLLFLIVLMVNA